MTPVFAHGDLRLYLLKTLTERPMHGYELIQALGSRFGGTYQPSAGTIYPRLAKLEDEGLVTKTADGRKTVYAITDAGREEVDARGADLDRLENEVNDSVRRLADEVRSSVGDAMRTLRADLAAAAREAGDDAKPSPDAKGGEAREQLQRAELMLAEFRAELRSGLRTELATGRLTKESVDILRSGLDTVRSDVLASLRRR
jgi:DNA-binding PadR family transcriptional regulator